MTLSDVAEMFQRAVKGVFHKRRLFFLFCVLCISGVVVVFFRSLASIADGWWGNTLALFPLFFVLGLVVSAEAVLIRLYTSGGTIAKTALGLWDTMLKIATFSLPLILLFLTLWMLSGLFLLLRTIPYFGPTLGVILSFAPFLFNLSILVLALGGIYLSFVICPTLALSRTDIRNRLKERLQSALFYDLLMLLVASVPLWLIFRGLQFAASLTFGMESVEVGSLEHLLQSFFMMIPFVACLTPPLLFFFNFAAEASRFREEARA